MGGNQGVIQSETRRVPAEKRRVRERETERERERQRERNGVWIMCGETPRELETLEREL